MTPEQLTRICFIFGSWAIIFLCIQYFFWRAEAKRYQRANIVAMEGWKKANRGWRNALIDAGARMPPEKSTPPNVPVTPATTPSSATRDKKLAAIRAACLAANPKWNLRAESLDEQDDTCINFLHSLLS